MLEWIGHNKLLRVVVMEGTFTNISPLRIGVGKRQALDQPVDLPVLTTIDYKSGVKIPVVPGSSWKGLFRSLCYKIANSNGVRVCEGLPRRTCLRGKEFDYIEKRDVEDEAEAKRRSILHGNPKVCIGCLVFGGPGIRSHVDIADSTPTDPSACRVGYRTCVAIDRRTGASLQRALFSVEYVEPGCTWEFRITLTNLPNYCIGWIAEALREVHNGIVRIGGMKSRGFGAVRFENLRIKVAWPPTGEPSGMQGSGVLELDPLSEEDVRVKLNKSVATTPSEVEELLNDLAVAWRSKLDWLRGVSNRSWKWVSED